MSGHCETRNAAVGDLNCTRRRRAVAAAPDKLRVAARDNGTDRRNTRETVLESIADAFGKEELPEALRDRLLTEGYIRLDTKGLLAKDRFILPSQIASAVGDEVTLNVDKDQLIKRP